jgi:hypothetical protein
MTSHTITGTYLAGYNVTAATLFNQGTISGPLPGNGFGLYSANSADIINSGTIAPGSLHPTWPTRFGWFACGRDAHQRDRRQDRRLQRHLGIGRRNGGQYRHHRGNRQIRHRSA